MGSFVKSFVRRNHIGVFAAVLAALIVLAMALGGFIASRGSSLVAEETSLAIRPKCPSRRRSR